MHSRASNPFAKKTYNKEYAPNRMSGRITLYTIYVQLSNRKRVQLLEDMHQSLMEYKHSATNRNIYLYFIFEY